MSNNVALQDNEVLTSNSDLDKLFDNLSNNINDVNRFITSLNNQKESNDNEFLIIKEERKKLNKDKTDFEIYMNNNKEELKQKKIQIEEYLNNQKEYLNASEIEFKKNMDNSLRELELSKKELEMSREKIKEEKEQFESYKALEIERIKHLEEIFNSEKVQFEKYKQVSNEKIELENKNLEQKCIRLKEIVNQFNSNFKPILEKEE